MKYFLTAPTICLAFLTFRACAAEVDLGLIENSKTFGNTFATANSSFEDEYKFTFPADNKTSAFYINGGGITNFSATLNGTPLFLQQFSDTAGQLFLSFLHPIDAGPHVLKVEGNALVGGSYFAEISVSTVETPVPAAFWLFGSALMLLFGNKQRNI